MSSSRTGQGQFAGEIRDVRGARGPREVRETREAPGRRTGPA